MSLTHHNKFMKKGFTLIELLVVITIIGILAVGGIQIYTSQIKKARDSTRIKDIMTLYSGFEQYYFDNGKTYLRRGGEGYIVMNFREDFTKYIPNVGNIQDPKDGCKNGCSKFVRNCASVDEIGGKWFCGYLYRPNLERTAYELSTAFESESNICETGNQCKSQEYNGNSNDRFEIGNNLGIVTELVEIGGRVGVNSGLNTQEGGRHYIHIHSNMGR